MRGGKESSFKLSADRCVLPVGHPGVSKASTQSYQTDVCDLQEAYFFLVEQMARSDALGHLTQDSIPKFR